MQKKTTILIIVIVLFLIGGGVYWWWENQEKEPKTSLEPVDYIQIKETPEGKIVENTKEGVSMKVPEGWEVQLPTSEQESVSLYSPEVVQGKKGEEYMCKISSGIEDKTTDIETLKRELDSNVDEWYTVELNTYEIIEINNHQALKNIFQSIETGYSVAVYIPTVEKLYSFVIYPAFGNEEKCSQEFDKFLEAIVIK